MGRKIYYKIFNDSKNRITDTQWEEVLRLQHWYNSEFFWTAGKIMFKMYAVFPNMEDYHDEEQVWELIVQRRRQLRSQGISENEMIRHLEAEGLILVKKGGYFDGCVASGFTRVAGNEWNAHLVCEFLFKVSLIAPDAAIEVQDEGQYIKLQHIRFHRGCVHILQDDKGKEFFYQAAALNRHVFAVVDPAKYDQFPSYQSTVVDFNDMNMEERKHVVKDLHWLGFENNYDINGDDIQGIDLNKKILNFEVDNGRSP